MKITLYDYCQDSNNFQLLKQWNSNKNGEITPQDLSYGSNKKVWWRCEKEHEWEAQIKSRVRGSGCPVCRSKKIVAGTNDLSTTHPDIAAQWHPTKNGEVTPKMISYGSHRKFWWVCDKGHEWEAVVLSRGYGTGCPVCAGKAVIPGENDLASMNPQLAAEWHPTKNGELRPSKVTPYSNRKVWWLCDKGHEYQAQISHRASQDSACPYCIGKKVLVGFNDLTTAYPKIADQWHASLNGELTPEMFTVGNHKKIWWQCSEGHIWMAAIYSRTGPKKHGCPVCAGNVSKKRLDRYNKILETAKSKVGVSDNEPRKGETAHE